MTHAESVKLMAFNAGSDARFRCHDVTENPYHGEDVHALRTAWEAGWNHMDQHWGERAKWPVALLLPVWRD